MTGVQTCALPICSSSRTLQLHAIDFGLAPDLSTLGAVISEEELKQAVFGLHPEKSPGPDGYTGQFFRVCWQIVKDDLMLAVRKLQTANSQNLDKLNSATMILLPKVNGANQPKDFRPISLIHCFGKNFSKIMASRLQPLMPNLVLPCQNAFIKGRSIHDNFVYVQNLAKALK